MAKKSMKLGMGGRFAKLTSKLRARGAKSPQALAAWIGMRKYGKKRMITWAVRGRKRARRK